MIATIMAFARYFVMLLFGAELAVGFAGMPRTQKNHIVLTGVLITLFILQVMSLHQLGMATMIKLYPLFAHLPMIIFIKFYLKRPWMIALVSMFVSFLCCQVPRWLGSVIEVIFGIPFMNHVGYIVTAVITYHLLQNYALKSVQHLMERSVKSCLLFGAMPAFYYLFEYAATVYTDFLFNGSRTALLLMPFMTATFYLVFVLVYYHEIQKQIQIQRELDMLDKQFCQAQTQFASMQQLQHYAATYRHDLRHHFTLLQAMASAENIADIKEYLKTAQSDMDAITPMRFCFNDTVNLILASFATKAEKAQFSFNVDAKLPDSLPLSDTELCSLLSNALENAITACQQITDYNLRLIKLRMFSKNNKLCIDIRNTYQIEPKIEHGLPVAEEEGHGFGTKSMVHIVEKHSGICLFSIRDGLFVFQATV